MLNFDKRSNPGVVHGEKERDQGGEQSSDSMNSSLSYLRGRGSDIKRSLDAKLRCSATFKVEALPQRVTLVHAV
jgi:hypothetical protein